MSQQPGKDERAFMEQLKNSAAEADIEGMKLEDALCLTLQSGILFYSSTANRYAGRNQQQNKNKAASERFLTQKGNAVMQ